MFSDFSAKLEVTRELVELLLRDFFSCSRDTQRFLKEFPRMPFSREILRGSAVRNVLEEDSLARRNLIEFILENPEILKFLAGLRSYSLPEAHPKITRKNLKRMFELCSPVGLLWALIAEKVEISEYVWGKISRLLGREGEKLRKEKQKIALSATKANFPEEAENLGKWKLLKKRNKSLQKENQRLKRQVLDLKEENKKLRQKSKESEKKCEKCEHRLENYGIGGLGFQRESLLKAFNEVETKGIKEKIRKGEKNFLKDLNLFLEEARDKLIRAESQICQWGQIKLLVVDGHNVIFKNISQVDLSDELKFKLENMLRFTMIRDLALAAEKLNCKIEAYFDTHYFQETVKIYKNLTVYYCPRRRGGADSYILRRIRNIENGQNVVVVSSDRKHIGKRVNLLKSQNRSVNCLSSETFFNYLSALEEFYDVSLQIEHYYKAIEENSQLEISVVSTAGK